MNENKVRKALNNLSRKFFEQNSITSKEQIPPLFQEEVDLYDSDDSPEEYQKEIRQRFPLILTNSTKFSLELLEDPSLYYLLFLAEFQEYNFIADCTKMKKKELKYYSRIELNQILEKLQDLEKKLSTSQAEILSLSFENIKTIQAKKKDSKISKLVGYIITYIDAIYFPTQMKIMDMVNFIHPSIYKNLNKSSPY